LQRNYLFERSTILSTCFTDQFYASLSLYTDTPIGVDETSHKLTPLFMSS